MYSKPEKAAAAEVQYQYELIECVRQFNQSESYIQKLEGQIRVLEAENNFLIKRNEEYEKKISLIVNSPFYKIGKKIYRILIMLHHKRE